MIPCFTRWIGTGLMLILTGTATVLAAETMSEWSYRCKIIFPGYTKTETLTNFPALVKLGPAITNFSYSQFKSAVCDDLRFTDSNGTATLDYEIDTWNTNGASFIWVRVPALDGTNAFVYAYWGKTGVSTPPSTTNGGTWTASDLAVYHLGATNGAPDARDATANRKDARSYSTTNVAEGLIGGAQGLNGSSTYLQGPTNLTGYGVSTSFTLSAWVRSTASSAQILMADGTTYTTAYGYFLISPTNKIGYGLRTGGTTTGSDTVPALCTSNVWHMLAQRYDGATVQLFFDGAWKHTTAKTGTIFPGVNPLYLGRRGDGYWVKGDLDEMRISSIPFPTNWIWASWLTAASNETFQSYGPATLQKPFIINLPPSYLTLATAALNGRLENAGRTGSTVSVYWGDTDGGEPLSGLWKNTNSWAFGAWTNGSSPSYLAEGLSPNTLYYYRFYAVNADGDSWPTESQAFSIADVWVEAPDAVASEDGDPGTLAIRRGATGIGTELVVNYTLGGTAPFGSHYTVTPEGRTVTFPVGVDTVALTVNPIWDGFREGDQTVDLSLAPGDYVIVPPATATVTIADAVLTPGLNTSTSAGFWNDNGNWSLGRQPVAGDEVVVRHAMTLSNSTYALAACLVTNGGILTFSGWTNRLQADDMTIGGGVLTLPEAFTNNGPSNRIWLVCTNLTLATNGLVNADYRGYLGGTNFVGPGWTNTLAAQGPGAGSGQCGSGYGGRGGTTYGFNQLGIGPAYGSPFLPVDPGSGGPRWVTAGGSGGGAIRIEASGTATLHGTITANGGPGLGGGDGGGSGGSILLLCGQFAGTTNGLLRALGGAGNDTAGGGGGGRIAVVYGTSPTVNPGIRFRTTEGGTYRGGNGQPGTLFLSDAALLTENLSAVQFIDTRLHLGIPEWNTASLTANGCKMSFAGNGFRLNVSNDFRVQTASRFGFGDITSTGMILAIGGNLIVTNGGTFYVYSGPTNGAPLEYSCLISVTNDILLGTNASKILPVSHFTNGGSALFQARNLIIPAGCAILGDSSGWATGMGPGKGKPNGNSSSAGGYGGEGGSGGTGGAGNIAGGAPYGSSNAPVAPGSGGGIGSSGYGNFGGGAVRLVLSGKADINGTISVNGGPALGNYGAGSGGGLLLNCQSLSGGANGLLAAKGGAGGTRGGGGGGGRIAVSVGLSDEDRAKLASEQPIEKLNTATNYFRFAGQAQVDGGAAGSTGSNGAPGTLVFFTVSKKIGAMILIR